MNIEQVQDNKHYAVMMTRLDSKNGTKCTINAIRICEFGSYKKAKEAQEAFATEQPSVRKELPDGSKEMIWWKYIGGKALKNMMA